VRKVHLSWWIERFATFFSRKIWFDKVASFNAAPNVCCWQSLLRWCVYSFLAKKDGENQQQQQLPNMTMRIFWLGERRNK
jgi:hypothetical protein